MISRVFGIWKKETKIFTRTASISSLLTGSPFICFKISAFRLPSGFSLENIQFFRSASPRHLAFAGVTGYQLSLSGIESRPLVRPVRFSSPA